MNGCILYVLLIEKVLEDGGLLGHLIDASFPFLQILLFYVNVSVDPVSTILSVRKGRVFPEAFDSPSGPAIKGEAAKGIALTSAAASGPCQAGQDGPTVHVTVFPWQPVVLLMVEATFEDYAWGSQSTKWAGHRGESRTS